MLNITICVYIYIYTDQTINIHRYIYKVIEYIFVLINYVPPPILVDGLLFVMFICDLDCVLMFVWDECGLLWDECVLLSDECVWDECGLSSSSSL